MDEYLIVINCRDDLEKKRVDYVIEKWNYQKLKGFVLKVSELNEEFLKEIHSKLVSGTVELYRIKPIKEELEIPKTSRRFRAYFDDDLERVEGLISFIFSKRKAVLKSRTAPPKGAPIEYNYSVYVKGRGSVDVKVVLTVERVVKVDFTLEGAENAVENLTLELIQDLEYLKAKVEL
jgi:hypothetical protein